MKRILGTLLVIVSPMVAAPLAAADDKPVVLDKPKPAEVKFETLKTKHFAVEIMVNGKGPYRVIFDTGAPMTVLNNKIAKEAELISKDTAKMPAFFGMRGNMIAKTLEIGELKAEEVPVVVMDHPALKAVSEVLGPIDGIVGFPFFARYRVTMDYEAQTMTFVPTDYKPENVMDTMMLMMLDMKTKPKKVFAPSTLWGFVVDKDKTDEEAGVEVKQVIRGSAAEAAGLKAGDRLLVLDGTWTDSVQDCYRAAGGVKAGEAAKAKVKRGDKEVELTITPKAGL